MSTNTLAIDFGTSNSAAAVLIDGEVERIAIEAGSDTLPTAVFFPANGSEMQIGGRATQSFIQGEDGRYMRALKSVLGTQLTHEKRLICGRYRTISNIVTDFLAALRKRSEAVTGQKFVHALSGRPVHFHSSNPAKDKQAEEDLRNCYLAAGFETVSFLAEPEAAALVYRDLGGSNGVGLIVDIGGGTSDFTLYRSHHSAPEILVNHGIRLGGTDFDHAISMKHAMPALGLGGQLRRPMGAGLLPVPSGPYVDLTTWSQIPFLYNGETRRMITDMIRSAVEPEKVSRLGSVIEMELGHELAFAVERAKIEVNASRAAGSIQMEFIEQGLAVNLSPDDLACSLATMRKVLHRAALETLETGGVAPQDVGSVILVGGSSLMAFISEEMVEICPNADILRSEAFTAVVDGLALAADQQSKRKWS